MNEQTMKPGVYLCNGCGIGDAVSVDALEQIASSEYKVPVCRQHDFLCGDGGRALIDADLAEGSVNQAIIAACSPRVMTDRFTFEGVPAIRANLREQVAWNQPAGEEDTQMLADDYLRMAISQAAGTTPTVAAPDGEYSRTMLVLGGGSTGLSAAIEAAKTGYEVLLVEREDHLGGWAGKWSKTMPYLPPYRDPQPNAIKELIADHCGGMLDGHTFKAYQPGGPSSGLLPASMDDIPLDFDTLQPHGTFIGSAAVVVLSDKDSAKQAAINMLRFFEDESCGQCTPCRVGCEKAVKLMQVDKWDQGLLEELSTAMVDTSICGLGQAAPNPIRMVIKHFPEEI